MKKLFILPVLFVTFVACQNTQNNDSEIKDINNTATITATSEVKEASEQDFDWIVDFDSYQRANAYAYKENSDANQKAYAENAQANQQAYTENANGNQKAYTEFHSNLVFLESELFNEDSFAFHTYYKKVEKQKKIGSTVASFEIQELVSALPKSSAMQKFYNQFIKFEFTRNSIYEKNADVRDKKYEKNAAIRDSQYEKNADVRDKKYELIHARYTKIGGQ